jgi:hypothetical protein
MSVSTIILIFFGVNDRMAETVIELKAVVKTSPTHITIVFKTRFVTASVLQIPSTWQKMGLFRQMPSEASFEIFDFFDNGDIILCFPASFSNHY